jgi:hypothetical protein
MRETWRAAVIIMTRRPLFAILEHARGLWRGLYESVALFRIFHVSLSPHATAEQAAGKKWEKKRTNTRCERLWTRKETVVWNMAPIATGAWQLFAHAFGWKRRFGGQFTAFRWWLWAADKTSFVLICKSFCVLWGSNSLEIDLTLDLITRKRYF